MDLPAELQRIMGARSRHLALQRLLLKRGAVAEAVCQRRFALLADLADYVRGGIDPQIAHTDPALFRALKAAETRYHLSGYYLLDPAALRRLAGKGN